MLSIPLLVAFLPVLASASTSKTGCDADSPPVSLGNRHEVTLSGSERTYMYFLPEKYDQSKPNPLILSFHGASRTSEWQADLDQLTDPYFNTDHVVVYPQALQYGENVSDIYWEGAPNATADDVTFVGDVLDELEKSLCIDTERVYATGKSQGGGFVGKLACDFESSKRIAAFAPVSGAFYSTGAQSDLTSCNDVQTLGMPCNPGRDSIPILDFHGGNDTTININGGSRSGGCLPSIWFWVIQWAARDNLAALPLETARLNGSAKEYQYGTGEEKGLVTFIYDGDHVNHDWPATINNTDSWAHGSDPASFNASTLIMEYFARYTLPKSGDDENSNTSSTITATGANSTSVLTSSFGTAATGTTTAVTTTASGATVSPTPSTPTSDGGKAVLLPLGSVSMVVCGIVWSWGILIS